MQLAHFSPTRWNPLKEMEDLQRRLSSAFGLSPLRHDASAEESMTVAEWAPLVDVIEDDKQYLIKVELTETPKENVQVKVENGVLTISGERRSEKEDKGRRFHRIERAYGRFERTFGIPDDADDSKVSADFKDGVLQVRIAKRENARPKVIDVKVN